MLNRLLGNMTSGGPSDHALRRLGLLVLAVILVARVVWLADSLRSAEPVSTAFDEDAYYEFAVSRNIAAGNGITAGHGERTSGFQPLWTFLLVPAFALPGSDRTVFASIYLLSIALWLTAAWLFAGPSGQFPASSVRWEWVKIDYGIRVAILEGIDLTIEFADNEMTLANGSKVSNDELLTTLRWRM